MGAQQSSANGANSASNDAVPAKTCYYEVLGIDRHASDDECVDLIQTPQRSSDTSLGSRKHIVEKPSNFIPIVITAQ